MIKNVIRIFILIVFITQGALIVQAATLEQLRDQFKSAENQIISKYDRLANQPGANATALLKQMNEELALNRKQFSGIAGKDPRYTRAEVEAAFKGGKLKSIPKPKQQPGYIDKINRALAEKNLRLRSTGGSPKLTPKHINADVDAVIVRADGSAATSAEQLKGLEIVKRHGVTPGEALHENAARFDNLGRDLTIWKPDSPEGQAAKLTDHDAFKTEGGRYVTRNPGAVQDAHGEYLDNRAKFEAARVEGDLKTQAKSLAKAGSGEAAGVKKLVVDTDGKETFVRESTFQRRNPELYDKAQKLQDYQTTHEAGITKAGDSPEVKQKKISEFQREMQKEMEALRGEAKRKGALRDKVRENFQKSYEKAPDPKVSEIAKKIEAERSRVVQSNEGAAKAVAKDQGTKSSKETFTGGRKGPGDAGHKSKSSTAESTPGKSPKGASGGKIKATAEAKPKTGRSAPTRSKGLAPGAHSPTAEWTPEQISEAQKAKAQQEVKQKNIQGTKAAAEAKAREICTNASKRIGSRGTCTNSRMDS